MPRLTDDAYLKNRKHLLVEKEAGNTAFVLLSAREQWDLLATICPTNARVGEPFSSIASQPQGSTHRYRSVSAARSPT